MAQEADVAPRRNLLSAIVRQRCPRCREGRVYRSFFTMDRACPECGYDFYPGSGFYLGAMMVPYFFAAMLTVPFAIALKLGGLEVSELLLRLGAFCLVVVC